MERETQAGTGRSLAERIAADGPLTVNEAAKVARALLSALEAMHKAGLVHGNVKPANVFLTDSGEVLLDGFGIAIPPPPTSRLADVISPEADAPHLTRGRDDPAARDMYSLGETLYEAVEGVSPFDQHTLLLPLTVFGEVTLPRHAGWLAPLITGLLRKDPDQRPSIPEALELIDSLGFPVTIYLSDEAAHPEVEVAVEELLRSEGSVVIERDDPVLGSWFRRMRAGADSSLTREVGWSAAHALDARLVHAQDAVNTSTLMQPLGPLLESLQPVKEAVIRVGALLIVKVDDAVAVHQLTATQQLRLDHHPSLLSSPRDILGALDLSFPQAPALAEARDEPGDSG